MTEALSLLFNLSVLIFVLASMFGMGLSLTIKQILAPLRNTSLVLKALAANFILVPLLAFLLARAWYRCWRSCSPGSSGWINSWLLACSYWVSPQAHR
jgi:predicted Na+-dependent transporter